MLHTRLHLSFANPYGLFKKIMEATKEKHNYCGALACEPPSTIVDRCYNPRHTFFVFNYIYDCSETSLQRTAPTRKTAVAAHAPGVPTTSQRLASPSESHSAKCPIYSLLDAPENLSRQAVHFCVLVISPTFYYGRQHAAAFATNLYFCRRSASFPSALISRHHRTTLFTLRPCRTAPPELSPI